MNGFMQQSSETIPRGQPVNIFISDTRSEHPVVGIVEGAGEIDDTIVIEVPETFKVVPEIRSKGLIVIWNNLGTDISYHAEFITLSRQKLTVSLSSLERRNYARVKCPLQMFYDVILPESLEEAAREILETPGELDSGSSGDIRQMIIASHSDTQSDKQLGKVYQMLDMINSKLDHIISNMSGKKEEYAEKRILTLYDISGSGLSFYDTETLKVGTFIKANFSLSHFPNDVITCVAQICRCDPAREQRPGTYFIAGPIIHIREDDRERIIHLVFKAQRKLLRNLKVEASL